MPDLFLDTSYAIALSSPPDQHHERALSLAQKFEQERVGLLTTRAVVLEIGNALAKQRFRAAGVRLLHALEQDPAIEIVPLSEGLYARALQMYQDRPDKEWGLTDCFSFVVMEEHGLTDSLTADGHFIQAGVNALLLSE